MLAHLKVQISTCEKTHTLKLEWLEAGKRSGKGQVYPFVWLREFCRCASCFTDVGDVKYAKNVINLATIDPEVSPILVKLDNRDEDFTIKVEWNDGHESEYSVNWLKNFKFLSPENDPYSRLYPNLQYWGSDVGEKLLKSFEFNDILTSDKVLYDWLIEIRDLGVAVLKNAPRKTGQVHRIGERVYFLRPSFYG